MIKISQKRTCEGCKALNSITYNYKFNCDLGYLIDDQKGIPLEKCPKPLKFTDFYECQEWYKKN